MRPNKAGERKAAEDSAARERIEKLLLMAEQKDAGGEEELSKRYVTLARKLAMRHRIRLGSARFCKACGAIATSANTKTRIYDGKACRVCAKCGAKRLVGRKQ